jgi:prophage regulatory protein
VANETSNKLRIHRLPEVKEQTGLSTATIYRRMRERKFPQQIVLGPNSVGWLESDIDNWIRERIERSQAAVA